MFLNTRKLSPGQKLAEHGIHFERLADGDGRYSVNIMVDGERIHRVAQDAANGRTIQPSKRCTYSSSNG